MLQMNDGANMLHWFYFCSRCLMPYADAKTLSDRHLAHWRGARVLHRCIGTERLEFVHFKSVEIGPLSSLLSKPLISAKMKIDFHALRPR